VKREEKEEVISEFNRKFSEAKMAILTEYSGLTVEELTTLRRQLMQNRCELRVVKNTLAKRAISGTAFQSIESHFQGPVAVAFGFSDPVAPTKVLAKFSEGQEKLKIKVGVVEGQILDLKGIQRIASLPGRKVLLGQLLGRMQFPLYGAVGTLSQLLRKFAFALSAVKEKREGVST